MPSKSIILNDSSKNHPDFWFINSDHKTQNLHKYRVNLEIFLNNSTRNLQNLNQSLLILGIKLVNFYHLLEEGKRGKFKSQYYEINKYICRQLEYENQSKFLETLNDADNFFSMQNLPCDFVKKFKEKSQLNHQKEIEKQKKLIFALGILAVFTSFVFSIYFKIANSTFILTTAPLSILTTIKIISLHEKSLAIKEKTKLLAIENRLKFECNPAFLELISQLEKQQKPKVLVSEPSPNLTLKPNQNQPKTGNLENKKNNNLVKKQDRPTKKEGKTREIQQEKLATQWFLAKKRGDATRKALEIKSKNERKRAKKDVKEKWDKEIEIEEKKQDLKKLQKEIELNLKRQKELEIRQNNAFEKWQCKTPKISLKCEQSIQELHQYLVNHSFFEKFSEIKLKGSFLYQFYLNNYLEGVLKAKDIDLEIVTNLADFTQNIDPKNLQKFATELFFKNKDCANFKIWQTKSKDGSGLMNIENIQITFNNLDFPLPLEITFRDHKYFTKEKDWICEFDTLRVVMKKEFYHLYSIIGNISEIIENIKKSDANGQYLINIDNPKIASYHEKRILSSENIVHFIQNNITHKFAEKLINDLFKSSALNAKQHGELMLQYYIKQDLKRVLETEIEEKENTVPKTNPKNAPPATALKSSAQQLQSSLFQKAEMRLLS